MKRVFISILVVLFVIASVSGCTNKASVSENETDGGIPKEDLQITIASGTAGSSWNVIATAVASLIEENIKGSNVTAIPGGGTPNIVAIGKREVDFAITYNNLAQSALIGAEPFSEEIDVDAICSFVPTALNALQVLIRDNVEVSSWREIIEKKFPLRISVGSRGATADMTLAAVLKEYGISYDDFIEWGGSVVYLGYPDSIAEIRDGRLDAMAGFPEYPTSYIVECMEAKPMKFLDIDDDISQKLVEKAGYVKTIIPSGTYKGQNKDNFTLGAKMIMVTRPDLPEELAYQVTKILIDNRVKLAAAVAQMEKFAPEIAWQETGAPLHPGSERFYRDAGVMK